MTRMLVDSNFLQVPALEEYLARSPANRVVLMDLQSMEMHKQNAEVVARRSTAILSRHPRQLLVLRPTRLFYDWKLASRARVNRLISQKETRGFAAYAAALQADRPTEALRAKMADLQHAHMQAWYDLVRDSTHIPETFKAYVSQLDLGEKAAIRNGGPFSRSLQAKLVGKAEAIAINLFNVIGARAWRRPNHVIVWPETFMFRYALCIMLHYWRWVELGQNMNLTPEQAANDVVDLHVAALGTFFNGVLSNDKNVIFVHLAARQVMRSAGAFVG